jgi:stage II sporulation protein D
MVAVLATAACARTPWPETRSDVPAPSIAAAVSPLRIAVAGRAESIQISATGAWELVAEPGGALIARVGDGEGVLVQSSAGGGLSIRGANGTLGALRARTIAPDDLLLLGSRRYRGSLVIAPSDSGLLVVNHVPLEMYLRGVVPIEIGNRSAAELAAVEAQAVAARSYAAMHRGSGVDAAGYDMVATVLNQAYGGVESETSQSNSAVSRTAGLVLEYKGRVIEAPYSSTCGGQTAAASDAWGSVGAPYLRSVSDKVPGSDHFYCEISPSFSWTRTWTPSELASSVARYASPYAGAAASGVRTVTSMRILRKSESGRVARLQLDTDRGEIRLEKNAIRFSLRSETGAILPSTDFDLKLERGDAGNLIRVVLSGRGNGHGVGMCQWGAIGRARAGQDFRRILAEYYPGTSLANFR